MSRLTDDVRALLAGKQLPREELDELRGILNAVKEEEDNAQVIISLDCDVPKSKLTTFRQDGEKELNKLALWAISVIGGESVRATVATYGVDEDNE